MRSNSYSSSLGGFESRIRMFFSPELKIENRNIPKKSLLNVLYPKIGHPGKFRACGDLMQKHFPEDKVSHYFNVMENIVNHTILMH